jgi:hypothetical protein
MLLDPKATALGANCGAAGFSAISSSLDPTRRSFLDFDDSLRQGFRRNRDAVPEHPARRSQVWNR